jgi:integrase
MKGSIIKRGKRWAVILDDKDERGRRRRKWHSGFRTCKEAETKCAELITKMAAGTYVEPAKITIAEHLANRMAQWIASAEIGPKTSERYREIVHGQINPHIGARPVQKLKVADVEAWHGALRTAGYSAGTIRVAHGVLSKALKDAVRHGIVPTNVVSLQSPPAADAEEVVIITEDQISDLLDKLQGRPIRTKVVIALFSGLRRGELLGLQWRDLDLDAKTLRVERALEQTRAGLRIKSPKTKSSKRTIALPDIVVDALREHRRERLELHLRLGLGKLAEDGFVFTQIDGTPLRPSTLTSVWCELAPRLGYPGIRWHSLRHTHASQLIASGLDVVSVARRLGHTNPAITLKVYSHLFRTADSRAAEIINAALAKPGPKR